MKKTELEKMCEVMEACLQTLESPNVNEEGKEQAKNKLYEIYKELGELIHEY